MQIPMGHQKEQSQQTEFVRRQSVPFPLAEQQSHRPPSILTIFARSPFLSSFKRAMIGLFYFDISKVIYCENLFMQNQFVIFCQSQTVLFTRVIDDNLAGSLK